MKIVKENISKKELKKMSEKMFGSLVKAVVDCKKEIMAVDGEMHADEEATLLERGSKQENLWGINLYPDKKGRSFIEFDSLINVRPRNHNRSRGVDNQKTKQKIIKIVEKLVGK